MLCCRWCRENICYSWHNEWRYIDYQDLWGNTVFSQSFCVTFPFTLLHCLSTELQTLILSLQVSALDLCIICLHLCVLFFNGDAGDAEKIFATHDVTNDDILTTKISEAYHTFFNTPILSCIFPQSFTHFTVMQLQQLYLWLVCLCCEFCLDDKFLIVLAIIESVVLPVMQRKYLLLMT